MPLPRPRTNVPRDQVHVIVDLMLRNPEVGDIDCIEQLNHNYTVRPRPRIPPPDNDG